MGPRRTSVRPLAGLVLALVALAGGVLGAQDLGELRQAFELEADRLDAEIAEYGAARERERGAVDRLQGLSRRLDDALADPNAAPAELVRLDAEISAARDEAFATSAEAGEARTRMYDRMRRLAELVRQVEREGIDLVGRSDPLGGMWQVEAQPIGVYGLFSLRREGSLVSGTYRLSNGRQGMAHGTLAGATVRLQLVDSEHGVVGEIEGELDAERGEIEGTWQAREVGSGRPAAGSWTALRLGADESPPP